MDFGFRGVGQMFTGLPKERNVHQMASELLRQKKEDSFTKDKTTYVSAKENSPARGERIYK
jgi:hypothetical protein